MITSGANQAFINLVAALCDSSDRVVLFKPYYFNHLMAIQMTEGGGNVMYGPCDPLTLHPDLDWLESTISGPKKPKMVVVVNPCNPTGDCICLYALHHCSQKTSVVGDRLLMGTTCQ